MNRFRKAIAAGMSAALLASLFTVIAASTALASTTVTGVGSVPRGGTSATAATFLFTESDIATLTTAGGSFSVYIWDNSGDCAVAPGVGVNVGAAKVHFTGTGTQTGPGSLDLSALVVGDNFFTIKTNNADNLNVETISIGGLKIKADGTAATGAIRACVYNDSGIFAAAFASGTTTATGKLASATGVSATAFFIAVDVGSCPFATLPSGSLGPIKIGTDSVTTATVSAIGATVSGQQDVTGAAPALAATHGANDVVTEKVTNCFATTLGSPGTVVDSLIYNDPGTPFRLNPGESNQLVTAPNLSATERTAGFLTAAATITLTITTPGVTFSNAPNADVAPGNLILTGTSTGTSNIFGILSADRMTVTWTVDTKSTVASTITFDDITYDVAPSVAVGTAVNVTLATSAGVVTPTSRSNAVVGRVLTVTSTSPVVYIGENNQTAGQVTIVETGPGFFTAGAGSNNTLVICMFTDEQFAAAPWAKVTGGVAAGNVILREGTTASTDNVVQGTAIGVAGFPFACYYWTVWTASTVASTITLSGDEAGTTGMKINVPPGASVGPVDASIRTGSIVGGVFNTVIEARATIALRQFRNQVIVTALSQPTIPIGSLGSPAGDIQIQETANGQLKFGERVCVEVLPNQNVNILYDVFLKSMNTADVPIVTASNGLVISNVSMFTRRCDGSLPNNQGNTAISFSFFIQQQSITGNGKVVISNIKYATVNDAVAGPVTVNVFGFGAGNTLIDFQSLISNAKIGAVVAGTAATRLGITQTGAFTTSTKLPHVNRYVTYRIDFGIAAAGAHVDIWGATKTGNDWSAFAKVTTRVANASGVVYYYIRQGTATWKSYRGNWVGGGVWSPARQAHWIP